MRKRLFKIIIIIILLILFIPIPSDVYKDGGTRAFTALTYKIVKWCRLTEMTEADCEYVKDGCYQKTSLYWFPDNLTKSIDELYEIEAGSIEREVQERIANKESGTPKETERLSERTEFIDISAEEEAIIRKLYTDESASKDSFYKYYFIDTLPDGELPKHAVVIEKIVLIKKMDCRRAIGAAYEVFCRKAFHPELYTYESKEKLDAWGDKWTINSFFSCDENWRINEFLYDGLLGYQPQNINIDDSMLSILNGLNSIELSVTFGASDIPFGPGCEPNYLDLIKYDKMEKTTGFHPAYGDKAVFHDYSGENIRVRALYLKESGGEMIYNLRITDPTAKTYRGIGIGSTKEEVIAAYPEGEDAGVREGTDYEEGRSFFNLMIGSGGIFYFKDVKVAEIELYGSAS